MDLNVMVNEGLAKIQSEGFVEKVIKEKLEKTIKEIMDDCLREYSDFGKTLKTQVQEQLKINLSQLDIQSYNHMILNVVKEKLDETLHVQGIEKIKESLDGILSPTKLEYKLSELIKELKDDATSYSSEDWGGKEISFHDDGDSRTLRFIYFDEEEDVRNYDCKYRIAVRPDGTVTSVTIGGKEFNNKVIMGGLHGLEETMFKLYTSGAKLIIDDIDVEYEGNDDY